MALYTSLSLAVKTDLTKADGLASADAEALLSYGLQWPDGTGADQANRVWQSKGRSLAASATEDLDLAGVLADTYGATITFARIKALVVKAASGNTNNVVLGNHATAAWVGPFGAATHTLAVPPNGLVVLVAPAATAWPVTAGTADMLKVTNSAGGTSVSYDIVLVGASA